MRNGQAYQRKAEKIFIYEEKSLVRLTPERKKLLFSVRSEKLGKSFLFTFQFYSYPQFPIPNCSEKHFLTQFFWRSFKEISLLGPCHTSNIMIKISYVCSKSGVIDLFWPTKIVTQKVPFNPSATFTDYHLKQRGRP